MHLPVTSLFIGLLGLTQLILTALVIRRRFAARVALLDGGDLHLQQRIRAHGNFTETVPITLLAMAAAELSSAPVLSLWLGGSSLLIGRLIHAINLCSGGALKFRILGMALTFLPMASFGFWSLAQGLQAL